MNPDWLLYGAQVAGAVLFALVCELVLKRRYEPGYTWAPATWGIAQVGLLVAARLAWFPLPQLPDAASAVWWLWWLIFYSFLWAAVPIWFWQIVIQDRRWRLAAAAWERWR